VVDRPARWRWLGHPLFLAGVAVLAVNDHVLKGRFPGWWTGKLSDVAGVAVAAVVAAVVVGPAGGVGSAALGFAALKSVPGVAEAMAPVLGGVTARDRSDLLALAVLVPVFLLLRPPPPPGGRRAGLAAVLPLAGATAAVLAGTATSCAADPAVIEVAARGPDLYARVDHGPSTEWVVTDDDGRTWVASEGPPGLDPDRGRGDALTDPGPLGSQEACDGDGTCYRLRDRRVVETRDAPGGDWAEEYRLTDAEFRAIDTGCSGGQRGVLGSLAVTGGGLAVASLGADGLLVRGTDGDWARRAVDVDG
jgi:hypothetical protein